MAPLDEQHHGRLNFLQKHFRRSLKFPRKLKFTREGKWFVFITMAVGFAAINTGNNLLYLFLGMLLALIVVSGVMSELSLRGLVVTRRLPKRAQVGRPHLVEIEVSNRKQKVPSYAIEIEDLREGQPADKRCFFLKISPDSSQVAAYRRTPTRRGLDRHVAFRLATRFPFGLFEKSREIVASDELVIYPQVSAVVLPPPRTGAASTETGRLGRGAGDEILTVRAMRDGDDPRDIYWKRSIPGRQLIVRERAAEARHEINLKLESTYEKRPDPLWLERFEHRIRETASRAVAHVRRGDQVTIHTTEGQRAVGGSSLGADPILRFLALLEPNPHSDGAKAPESQAS